MREYRLIKKKKGELYYPQVREDKFSFMWLGRGWFPYKSEWKRIARHIEGFGLYSADDFSHSLNYTEATKLIHDYEEFIMEEEPPYVFSYYSQASVRYDIERKNNPKPIYQMSGVESNQLK